MEPELSWYVSQNYLPGNWDHFGQLWKELADYAWLKSLPKAQRTQGIESLNYIEFFKPINQLRLLEPVVCWRTENWLAKQTHKVKLVL